MAEEANPPPARRIAALFAKCDDPYAGANLALAQRMVALMWGMAVLLAVAFVPFAPPTAIGWPGWVVFAATIAGAVGITRFVRRGGPRVTFDAMLLLSYLGLVELAGVQWLTGGNGSPFAQLYLLAVIAGVGVHPPRRAAPLLLALVVAASSPIAYDGLAAVADIAPRLMLWLALALVVMVLMHNVRLQRIALQEAEMRAEADARVDALTRIGNRRAFDEALPEAIALARRAETELSLMVLDVDCFKAINDRAGHAEGDRALTTVAQALKDGLRASDQCYRWGGDEFAVLLPDTAYAGALALRDRVEVRLAEVAAHGFQQPLELSWGVAALTADDDDRTLLGRADLELMGEKARKQDGRAASAASA